MYNSDKSKIKKANLSSKRKLVNEAKKVYRKKSGPMNRATRRRTNPEKAVQKIIEELGIKYEIEKPLKYKNEFKYYDILLIDYNILIEVDGDYWHGNLEENTNNKALLIKMKNKQNDYIKNAIAKQNGYRIMRIKEKDIKESIEKVTQDIKDFIESENL